MNIRELNEIISLMDLDKICLTLERRGFRRASENFVWEFDYETILTDCSYVEDTVMDTSADNLQYRATLCKGGEKYRGRTFIILTLSLIKREFDNLPIPQKMLLFTDVTYNENYVKDINSIVHCDKCKNSFVKKEMLEHNEKLFCSKCYINMIEESLIKTEILKHFKN